MLSLTYFLKNALLVRRCRPSSERTRREERSVLKQVEANKSGKEVMRWEKVDLSVLRGEVLKLH